MSNGRTVGYDDTVKATSAVDADHGGNHNNTEAKERFADGTNTTSRHMVKNPSFGKLGKQGHPK